MAVHASEDVGMASPQALVQVIAAKQAFEFIGWPEARIPIAQAIIFLCESPKSNSVIQAIDQAFEAVRRFGQGSVPLHLRDAHYSGAKALGVKGYRYPHDYPNHYVKQQYMPDHLPRVVFYHPSDQGYEAKIRLSKERRDSD
jgi:putative ATPase